MLQLDEATVITAGQRGRNINVWTDDQVPNKFYVLPAAPTLRLEQGRPVFKFMKYASDVDQDGKAVMGGIAIFDVELAVYPDELEALKPELLKRLNARQPADKQFTTIEFGAISFSEGTVVLNISNLKNELVEQVISSGQPSLYGSNVATFTAELTKLGAPLFEQAMKGEGGSLISVTYDLSFAAMLPPNEVKVRFKKEKLVEHVEKQGADKGWGQQQEHSILQTYKLSEAGHVEVNIRDAEISPERKQELEEWGHQVLQRMIAEQIDPDVSKVGTRSQIGTAKFLEGKSYSDSVKALTDFTQTYSGRSAILYHLQPQATLPALTAMRDAAGNLLVTPEQLGEYFTEVRLNDPFFDQLRVDVTPVTDFVGLGLNRLEVQIEYGGKAHDELVFSRGDADTKTLRTNLIDGRRQYSYSYQAYFAMDRTGKVPTYTSPRFDNISDTSLALTANEIPILFVSINANGQNWELVRRARLTLAYDDAGTEIVEQLDLDNARPERTYTRVLAVVPERKAFRYKVVYTFHDGTEYETAWQEQTTSFLPLNSPFAARSYSFEATGSLKDIELITLNAAYHDLDGGLSFERSVVLDSAQKTRNWLVPSLKLENGERREGQLTYSGHIQYTNGDIEPIAPTTTSETTIRVGRVRAGVAEVEVSSDGLDFENLYKRVEVELRAGRARERYTFREEGSEDWSFDLAERNDRSYEWRAELQFRDRLRHKHFGTVYLPGPTANDWGREASAQLLLQDYIPEVESLAERGNLLAVTVSKRGVDWSQADGLTAEVYIKYGDGREQRVEPIVEGDEQRAFAEGNGDDDPHGLFLAPLMRAGNGAALRSYQWRAVFRAKGEDAVYYPGPHRDDYAEESAPELHLSDYLSRELGGTRDEA